IASQTDEDLDVDYGFQRDFDDEDEEEVDLELEATKQLFDSADEYKGQEENVERFCLPLFAKSGSDYAVDYFLYNFKKRPAMAQIYVNYLAKFTDDDDYDIVEDFADLLEEDTLYDWQKMWILAGLLRNDEFDDKAVKLVWDIYGDPHRHEAL